MTGVGQAPRDDQPGERRLERPPSERYGTEAATGPASATTWPIGRGTAVAAAAAIVGAAVITIAGGLLAITAGLLVVAAALGWVVAASLSRDVDPAAPGRQRRRALAAVFALAGVALGQVGLWVVARAEGGTLGLIDYLAEVFGILVPLQFGLAGAIAWWQAR
jgi:hypothetical protein